MSPNLFVSVGGSDGEPVDTGIKGYWDDRYGFVLPFADKRVAAACAEIVHRGIRHAAGLTVKDDVDEVMRKVHAAFGTGGES